MTPGLDVLDAALLVLIVLAIGANYLHEKRNPR